MAKLEDIVYKILIGSQAPLQLREIYALVKSKAPELCDDTILCSWCKYKHPKWQHQISWDLQHLKRKGLVRSAGKGYWTGLMLKV